MVFDERYIEVSLDELQTPKQGYQTITDSWWCVKDGHVLGFKLYGAGSKERPTPQCNKDKRVVDRVMGKMYPDHEAVHIPVAYWWPPKH